MTEFNLYAYKPNLLNSFTETKMYDISGEK